MEKLQIFWLTRLNVMPLTSEQEIKADNDM